jgi:predicted amidohydrolase YtcJ
VHIRELGMDSLKANLVGVSGVKEMVERLKDKFPRPAEGDWLIGQGWDEGSFASTGYPDRRLLDIAFPNNPVALESLHGFAGLYNGYALKLANINSSTKDPEVGNIIRRTNGEPTGVMLTLAQNLIRPFIPEPSNEKIKDAIIAGLNTMASAGVTSIHEAGMTPKDVKAFISLAESNSLPIRVYGMLDGNNDELMKHWFARGPLVDKSGFLDIRSIKVFYDGSLGSRTALMEEPYSDQLGKSLATERISTKKILQLGRKAADKGFQMAVHAIGDKGNNQVLKLYEEILDTNGIFDHRWRIEHAQVLFPNFYNRAAELKVLASMQSSHAVGDSKWAEDRIGSERIQDAYAWQNILKSGVRLLLNSDLPGEPWKPMETLYFAVNRKPLDSTKDSKGWYMKQALTVEEALKAMTIENAHGAFQEKKLGSIEINKFADFIIIDKNPLTVAPEDIKNIEVLETWVSGIKVSSIN